WGDFQHRDSGVLLYRDGEEGKRKWESPGDGGSEVGRRATGVGEDGAVRNWVGMGKRDAAGDASALVYGRV
ncbi:hypothetical protein ACLOJK_037000, partial [Asimina triloba]